MANKVHRNRTAIDPDPARVSSLSIASLLKRLAIKGCATHDLCGDTKLTKE